MSYRIYQTEAWVLGGIDVKEDSRFIDMFTQDLGLVRGFAQGVRKLRSKLRYGLRDFSRVNISLVKGREIWRIVGVEVIDRINRSSHEEDLEIIARIFSLMRRLIKGEEKDMVLYYDINAAIDYLTKSDLTKVEIKKVEIVIVYRILHKLGYIPDTAELNFLLQKSWCQELISFNDEFSSLALRQINSSLAYSHL